MEAGRRRRLRACRATIGASGATSAPPTNMRQNPIPFRVFCVFRGQPNPPSDFRVIRVFRG